MKRTSYRASRRLNPAPVQILMGLQHVKNTAHALQKAETKSTEVINLMLPGNVHMGKVPILYVYSLNRILIDRLGDPRADRYLAHRISITIQRENSTSY